MSNRTRTDSRIMRQKRGRKKVSGTSERPRMSVFVSNKQVYTQIIDDTAGKTLVSLSSLSPEIKEQAQGKPTAEKAELIGAEVAKLAKEAGIEKIVFDKSGYRYGKRMRALADAARKGGLNF